MRNNKIKVLYIASWWRSGSTILDRILGQIPGFFSIGEFYFVWNCLIENRPCGCGVPVRECAIWGKVLDKAFGDLERVDFQEMIRLRKSATSIRRLPLLLSPWSKPALKSRSVKYLDNLETLYQAMQSIAGSQVIVDSSKFSTYGYLLGMSPAIDLHVVHLVRDPRAVAYSLLRKKLRQDTGNYMMRHNSTKSSVRWSIRNLIGERLFRRFSGRYLRLRYEDLIENPRETIARISELVNEQPENLPFVGEHAVRLDATHTVWGNPNRMQTGPVELRLDDEWMLNMRLRDRIRVTALTWPLLVRYGYKINPRRNSL